MKPISHRSLFLPFLASLIALAWAILWMWERSPYGRYLTHGELGHIDVSAGVAPVVLQAGVYVAGWVLMTAAMMLPTTLPLVEIFRRLTVKRDDRTQLVVLLIIGYLAVWLAFGVAAHLFDFGLHEAFEESEWLQANAWRWGWVPPAWAEPGGSSPEPWHWEHP